MVTQTLHTTTGKLRITIPTKIEELRLKQLIALQEKPNMTDLDAISILAGIPITELKQVNDFNDFQLFNIHILTLSQSISKLYNSTFIPKYLNFSFQEKELSVKVPNNLSVEPAGAFMAARDIIAEEIKSHIQQHGEEDWQQRFNPSLQACSLVLAHYLYCLVTRKLYDEHEATSFTEIVNELPITDALPLAKHFFLSYPNLLRPKTGYWHHQLRRLNNGRVFKSLKSFGLLTR